MHISQLKLPHSQTCFCTCVCVGLLSLSLHAAGVTVDAEPTQFQLELHRLYQGRAGQSQQSHLQGPRVPRAGRRAQVGGPKATVEVSQRRVTGERVRGRLQVAEASD